MAPHNALVQHHPKREDVRCLLVLLLVQDLRRHVRRRPNALRELHVRHQQVDVPGAPKVRLLPVDVKDQIEREDKDVVRLDVPVQDAVSVQALQPLREKSMIFTMFFSLGAGRFLMQSASDQHGVYSVTIMTWFGMTHAP